MNRIRIALPPVLFFSLITFGYAQQQESGQQPDPAKQEETKHPQDATPPDKPAEANPSRESRPQEESLRNQKSRRLQNSRKSNPKPIKKSMVSGVKESRVNGTTGKALRSAKPAAAARALTSLIPSSRPSLGISIRSP